MLNFAVALHTMDNSGNKKIRAFSVAASNQAEAIGKAFIEVSSMDDLNSVVDWDVNYNKECLADVARDAYQESGNKIQAIKAVRTFAAPTYIGLREAKDLVESVI
jgi:ribosomal protein L7/L12